MTEHFKINKRPKIKLLSRKYIYARLILLYTFAYTAAFMAGCLLFHMLEIKSSATIDARIFSYFSAGFSDCDDLYDYCGRLLSESRSDITHLILIFTAGFTMFSTIALTGILMFRGASFGFSVSYLAYAIKYETASFERPVSSIVLFSVLCATSAAILIHMCVKTAIFTDEFKTLCGRPRLIVRSKAFYMQIFRFFTILGAILILNLIRCVL